MTDSTSRIGYRRIPVTMVVDGHDVPAILDTGAMTCCVPDPVMRDIGATPVGSVGVGGAIGHQNVPAYRLNVGIKGLDDFEEEVEILGLPSNTALLGFNLFSRLAGIDISFERGSVTFHTHDARAELEVHEADDGFSVQVNMDGWDEPETIAEGLSKAEALHEFYQTGLSWNPPPDPKTGLVPAFQATVTIIHNGEVVAQAVTGAE